MEKFGLKSILIIAAIMAVFAFSIYAYLPKNSAQSSVAAFAGRVLPGGSSNTTPTTILNTTTSVAPVTVLPTNLPTANKTASGGFLNSQPVTFLYGGNIYAIPASNTLLGNSSEVVNSLAFTNCEVGAAGNNTGQLPLWITVPAYAGLSIFGVPALGASQQGFPTSKQRNIN